jgi:hypothetical protein
MKIFEGLSNSKNMVFDVKNLFNIGVGLTLRQGAKRSYPGGMSGRFCGFNLSLAGFCW